MNEECLICKAPLVYLDEDEMMEEAFCHMHGPEHHVLVGAALLTAYRNAVKGIPIWQYFLRMIS